MNKKSLLLLIPFATAALAGCTPIGGSPDPCESATVTFNEESVVELKVGDIYVVDYQVSERGCSVAWASDNSNIASVVDGEIEAIGVGETTIYANGVPLSVKVTDGDTPTPPPVTPTLNLDKYDAIINLNGSTTITAAVFNSDAGVEWSVTSGSDKIQINPNGKTVTVTGIAAGSAVVQAKIVGENVLKTCNITIKGDAPVVEGVVLDFDNELNAVSGTKDGVTFAAAVGAGQSEPTYNDAAKELRLYAKNTLTISGANITRITFDFNGCFSEDSTTCHKATADFKSVSTGSYSDSVWTGTADSITFTVEDVAQMHVHKIGVECAQPTPPAERILDSISVSNEHREFEVGDEFVKETVTAHFTNSADATISNATFTGFDMSNAGTQTVSVSYTENNITKTTSYTITVRVPTQKTEYTLTATSKTEFTDTDNCGAEVTIGGATGYESDRGTAWNKAAATITISNVPQGTIKGIEMDVSANKETKPSISVKVGGNTYGTAYVITKANHQTAKFEGTVSANKIVITIDATTDGSAWVKTIKLIYEAEEPAPTKTLSGIEVTTGPSKTAYNEGESFDSTGMVVTASYTDADPEIITNYTITPNGSLSVSDTTITIAYGGFTDTVTISVSARTLESISLDVTGFDKEYVVGENWDAANVKVVGHYNFGNDSEISSDKYDLTFNPTAPALGVSEVSITAALKSGSVSSANATVTGIVVNPKPAPAPDDFTDREFTKITSDAELEDGMYVVGTSEKFFSGVDENKEAVSATVQENKVTFTEGMLVLEISKVQGGYTLKCMTNENKGQYVGGLSANSNGILYSEDELVTTISITSGAATISNNGKYLKYNTTNDTFKYYKATSGGVELASLYKMSDSRTITGVAIEGTLTYATQYVGDSFDSTGLNVRVSYDDSTSEIVTKGVTWSATSLTEANDALHVTASYKGNTSSNDVVVKIEEKVLQSIYIASGLTTKEYYVGEEWAINEIVVKAQWNVGEDTVVNSTDYDLEFDPADPAVGITQVKITVTLKSDGSKSAELNVTGISVVQGDNYGTKENPITSTQAKALIAKVCPQDGNMTDKLIYFEGKVTSTGTWNNTNKFFSSVKVATDDGELLIYSLNLETGYQQSDLQVGKMIKAYGYGKNYQGTMEIDKLDLDHKAYVYSIADPVVTAVSIGGDFSKKLYNVDTNWDVSGLTFTATTTAGSMSLTKDDFNFSFNPTKASTVGEGQSVTVTATLKTNAEISVQKTITGITVTEKPASEPISYSMTVSGGKVPTGWTNNGGEGYSSTYWKLKANNNSLTGKNLFEEQTSIDVTIIAASSYGTNAPKDNTLTIYGIDKNGNKVSGAVQTCVISADSNFATAKDALAAAQEVTVTLEGEGITGVIIELTTKNYNVVFIGCSIVTTE